MQSKIEELKKVKDGADRGAIDAATAALSTEMQKIGEHIAKNSPQQAPGDQSAPSDGEPKDAAGEEKADN